MPRPRSAGGATRTGGTPVTLLLAVLLGLASALLGAGPAMAANTFVEITPNTAEPGNQVTIRASCDDGNNRQVGVQSDAFGRVMLRPDNGFLTGRVTVPGGKAPGSYGVNLTCNNGNTANTTVTIVNMSKPTQGPATGGGGTAGGDGSGLLMIGGGLAVVVVAGFGYWLSGLRRRGSGAGH